MFECQSSVVKTCDYKNIRQNRKENVKSLILGYENVLSQMKSDTIIKKMGVEHSIAKANDGIVKQRINEYNNIENKYKRSVSTHNTIDRQLKEFQRSKSEDMLGISAVSINNISNARWNEYINIEKQGIQKKQSMKQIKQKKVRKRSKTDSEVSKTPEVNFKDIVDNTAIPKIQKDNLTNHIGDDKFENIDKAIKEDNSVVQVDKRTNGNNIDNNLSETDIRIHEYDKEFDAIDSKMQDATRTIYEMAILKNEPVFISEVRDFIVTNTAETTPSFVPNNEEYASLGDIENIDIYLYERDILCTSVDDEYGEVHKNDLINTEFVEAFNQEGHELLVTSVHSVELQEENNENEEVFETETGETPKLTTKLTTNMSANSSDRFYFTKEELEALISDEDYELEIPHTPKLFVRDDVKENIKNRQVNDIKSINTIYDSFKIPRISKVRSITNREDFSKDVAQSLGQDGRKNYQYKTKIDFLIEELIDSERRYMDQLESVVEDYLPYFKTNNQHSYRVTRVLFGNIKEIYKLTQQLYRALKGSTKDYESVANIFVNFQPLFEMYPWYFKNKPAADYYLLTEFKDIVLIRERELNDQLGLSSHLLTPIQRLGKYILLLKQINEELTKSGIVCDAVVCALNIVKSQMSIGNDYIAVDSIKKCPVALLEHGSFVMSDKFTILKPKKYEAVIFFFEEIIVITTVHSKHSEYYIYRDSIKLNEMVIITYENQPLIFHLKRFSSTHNKESKEHNHYIIAAKKEKDKLIWTEQIEKRLWEQLIKCKERQQELNNNARKKSSEETSVEIRKKRSVLSKDPEETGLKRKSKFYIN
ncbi:hypothetical protein FQA39_LY08182 [Lamprigera yunnana]|nr:hypothetical protein FQA39_LY08182 [Lamprigera yunnana]